ncbi:class I SAM-dependent methyltransferase [Patescibacteria group bacterium]|nr:class I SAM-dependent methyltransferase [Patescibacteria group bacterium]
MLIFLYGLEILVVLGVFIFVVINGYSIIWGAPYVSSTDNRVRKMVAMLGLKKGARVADLGAGNGIIVRELLAKGYDAYGYEISPWLVWRSGLRNRIFLQDYWRADLSGYQAITVYGIPYIMKRLEKKLWKELPKGTKIVSSSFKFPGKKPIKENGFVYLYKI